MKDSEFINLLNLYLDHEIGAADAARLEAEVQNNPARRRIYREYCQMQKACKVLAADFQTEPVAVPERKVIDFRLAARGGERSSVFYTLGALTAAAACVAIVVIGRTPASKTGAANAIASAQTTPVPAAMPSARVQPAALATTTSEAPKPTMFVNDSLSLAGHAQARALAASNDSAPQFTWISEVRLAPIQTHAASLTTNTSSTSLEARPTLLQTESQTYNGNRPFDPNVTPMVIRFQK